EWADGAQIDLMDAYVRVIATDDVWPASLHLEDFHVDRVEQSRHGETTDTDDPPGSGSTQNDGAKAIADWLQLTNTTSLEPYYALADVLRKRGASDQAKDLMIDGWERRRRESSGLSYLWLSTKHYLINYGYEPSRALIGILVLLLVGMLVVRRDSKGKENR